jgi:hypothetical protein
MEFSGKFVIRMHIFIFTRFAPAKSRAPVLAGSWDRCYFSNPISGGTREVGIEPQFGVDPLNIGGVSTFVTSAGDRAFGLVIGNLEVPP